jgi:hypothetical protein
MSSLQQRERAAVVHMLEFMRQRGLTLDDLVGRGGEDLRSPNPAIVKKARYVERAWERMVAAALKFADLEEFASQPANLARYPKQLKNQRLTRGSPVGSPSRKRQVDQALKNSPPSYYANGAAEPGKASVLTAEGAQ